MVSEKHTPLNMQFLISWTCHTDKYGQAIILMRCFIDLKEAFDTVDHILLLNFSRMAFVAWQAGGWHPTYKDKLHMYILKDQTSRTN